MPIALKCIACEAKMTAPDSAGGKTLHCPKCGNLLLVPSSSGNAWNDPDIRVEKQERPRRKKDQVVFAKKEKSFPLLQASIVLICLVAVVGLSAVAYIYVSYHLREKDLEKLSKEEKVNEQLQERQALAKINTENFVKSQQNFVSEREKHRLQAEENTRIFMEQQEKARKAAEEKQARADERQTKLEEEQKKEQEKTRKQAGETKRKQEEEIARQKEIEEDHKIILAYRKLHVQASSKFVNLTWDDPSDAIAENGQKGKLYRVEGALINEVQKTPTSYYFFLVNRKVVKHQNGEAKLTICKVTK
jgi:hypothetical protein